MLPGVLHSNAVWGNGTTEYALDALLAAPHQETKLGLPTTGAFLCPVDPDVKMPMVYVDDLMRGLCALQEADEAQLSEPERGYCIPGLSFSANELFAEIRKHDCVGTTTIVCQYCRIFAAVRFKFFYLVIFFWRNSPCRWESSNCRFGLS